MILESVNNANSPVTDRVMTKIRVNKDIVLQNIRTVNNTRTKNYRNININLQKIF